MTDYDYCYLYDGSKKEEAWAILKPCPDYDFYLEIVECGPLGSLISEAISIDFESILSSFEYDENNFELMPFSDLTCLKTFSYPSEYYGFNDVFLEYINYLIAFREFVNICFEDNNVLSTDYFDRFCEITQTLDLEPERIYARLDKIPAVADEVHVLPIGIDFDCTSDFDIYSTDPLANIAEIRKKMKFDSHVDFVMGDARNVEIFRCLNPVSIYFQSLRTIAAEGRLIKKCKSCGKYFVPVKRSDAIYCDRPSPVDQTKTCKEIGPKEAWQKVLKESESASLYRKIYMSKQMRVKRNPESQKYKDDFDCFKDSAKSWKSKLKSGAASNEEYLKWLNEVYSSHKNI